MNYDELLFKVKSLRENKEVIVIAISGHGGSGKSTLAQRLAVDLGIGIDQILGIDELHARGCADATQLDGLHDWDAIYAILEQLRTRDRMQYMGRDYWGNEKPVDVERPEVVICEGIRLIHPNVLKYVDLSIWVDCPIDIATDRAKERNRLQGDSEEEIELWDTRWVPESLRYIELVHPEQLADVIYRELG